MRKIGSVPIFQAVSCLDGYDPDALHVEKAREHVLDHRSSVQRLQALVDAAHAPPQSACQNYSRYADAADAVHAKILRLSFAT